MATKPNYTDAELQDLEINSMASLELQWGDPKYEDALQCILLLVDDLREANKLIKELKGKNAS